MTVKTIGIAGTGLIGAGWAARAMIRGINVIAYDVSPAAEEKLKAQLERLNLLQQITLQNQGEQPDKSDFSLSLELVLPGGGSTLIG